MPLSFSRWCRFPSSVYCFLGEVLSLICSFQHLWQAHRDCSTDDKTTPKPLTTVSWKASALFLHLWIFLLLLNLSVMVQLTFVPSKSCSESYKSSDFPGQPTKQNTPLRVEVVDEAQTIHLACRTRTLYVQKKKRWRFWETLKFHSPLGRLWRPFPMTWGLKETSLYKICQAQSEPGSE